MFFILALLKSQKEKTEQRNTACNNLICELNYAIHEMDNLFIDKVTYIDHLQGKQLYDRWLYLLVKTSLDSIRLSVKTIRYKELFTICGIFQQTHSSISNRINFHNNNVAKMQIENAMRLIGKVEGRQLDEQQMLCILKKAYNHLVVAGAGTGKTTTIVGKIKYLLNTNACTPAEILVLSFTNASAAEMRERIQKETKQEIEALTFHKLGLNILTQCNHIVPKITKINLSKFIKEELNMYMEQQNYLSILISFLLFNKGVSKSEFEFRNQSEYEEYLTQNPPITLKNDVVKSYGELDIANFLAMNGIDYIYEEAYVTDTRTMEYAQYYPDFYLSEYKIYIEYFGINRNGEVPQYFKGKNGNTGTQTYQDEINWKRKLHKENNTILVECYFYEKDSESLLHNLEVNLKKYNVTFLPKSPLKLWEEITASENSILDGLTELMNTIINLIKSNNYSINHVRRINNQRAKNTFVNSQMLLLIEPIFSDYNNLLQVNGEIDFNDMINIAVKYVTEKRYLHNYKYVIVDEYQDISKSRYALLHAMRSTKDYSLFCVGDDWQSIYRFAGSDTGLILNFQNYWGASEMSKIETTYRFNQKLIDITGNFIMKNPKQIKKSIQGKMNGQGFPLGEISGYNEKCAVEFMTNRLCDLPKDSTVYFIGRYNFDQQILNNCSLFKCEYDNVNAMTKLEFSSRKDLKMNFITAHKSKGLQADYVIIINNKNSKIGFPSKIQNAPILDLLLDDSENFDYAEERRLFYVAMTRAKKKVLLLTINGKESSFVDELKMRYGKEMKSEAFECPICGGNLIKKTGRYGEFYGCSNYKSNNCEYTRKIKVTK
ncbi:MAG: UvrD-helicase domain-containing protein [Mobilitalea sp.]